MITPETLGEENRKMRLLRVIVDLTAGVLISGGISQQEGLNLIRATRKTVLHLFPGKESVYDLIYKPRFERLFQEGIKKELLKVSKN